MSKIAAASAEPDPHLEDLLAYGRKHGQVSLKEISQYLATELEDEALDLVLEALLDAGIEVLESDPDEDEETLIDDSEKDDIAAEAAAASEDQVTTDPIRMYMQAMGAVSLLSRQQEIEIAKRIERSQCDVAHALAQLPTLVMQAAGQISGLSGKETESGRTRRRFPGPSQAAQENRDRRCRRGPPTAVFATDPQSFPSLEQAACGRPAQARSPQ